MSLPLSGKVAIITGSSRSIGAAIAARLASRGANVVINYVSSASAAQAVADTINSKGTGRAIIVKADVGVLAEGRTLVDEAVKTFGRVDFLLLNAGVMKLDLLDKVSEEDYEYHFNTNVKGPLFLVQHAVPHMQPGLS